MIKTYKEPCIKFSSFLLSEKVFIKLILEKNLKDKCNESKYFKNVTEIAN